MLLLLVRHALTPITGRRLTGWLPGFHLSEEGEKQAANVAERLSTVPLKAIYSSPLERCSETAEMIAQRHGLEVVKLEGIGEVRYGDWQGRTFRSLYGTKAWRQLRARPADFRFPKGETIREAQTRGMAAVEELLGKHRGKVVVVVSHADLIRLIVAGYVGLSLELYTRMTVGPASVTAISFEDVPRLLKLSDTGSLDDVVARAKAVFAPRRRNRELSPAERGGMSIGSNSRRPSSLKRQSKPSARDQRTSKKNR